MWFSRRHPKSFRTGSLTIRATHPSTPPVPLSRKISLSAVKQNGNSNSSELSSGGDSAEEDGDTSSSTAPATSSVENSNLNQKTSTALAGSKRAVASPQAQGSGSLSRLPPELVDRLVRRSRKSSSKHYKAAHLKRVRKANEIQRQLEEIDVKHRVRTIMDPFIFTCTPMSAKFQDLPDHRRPTFKLEYLLIGYRYQ